MPAPVAGIHVLSRRKMRGSRDEPDHDEEYRYSSADTDSVPTSAWPLAPLKKPAMPFGSSFW